MSTYNRFGAVYTGVIELYPGTVVGDYGGQTIVENEMDRITREVAASMMPNVFEQMTQVRAEWVVRYATAAQTGFTLGMHPVTAGTVHLWVYPPIAAYVSQNLPGYFMAPAYYREPTKGVMEVASTDYSVTASSGAITYSGSALQAGARVYASYDVDMDNASFSLASLADAVVLGAAAALGSKLFSDATQQWQLVKDYQARYNAKIAMLMDGKLIPDEVRRIKYWEPVERISPSWGIVDLKRG
jgi:hypothetical protein